MAVIAANLSQPAVREPRDRCGSAEPRLISDFDAVATAAALPRDNKARSNRRDERRSATTHLNAQSPGILCGLLNSVVDDMAPTHSPRGDIQPQSRDLLLRRGFDALHLDKRPMRAPQERIRVRLLEHGLLGETGAAHGYPD